MSVLPAPTESALRRAVVRAERGVTLDAVEAETLLHARGLGEGEPLDRLLTAAGRVRDAGLASAGRPGIVTYSRKVFIPLTHLCRDRCHYCTFVTTPGQLRAPGKAPFLSPDEVLDVARAGAAMGCKEALFTLGDRPEERWPVAAEWLHAHGFDSTLAYLRAMAIRVLEETGLLPHLNPGVLSWEEIQRLKPVSASMGMMLETTATRLWSEPGGPHYGSPDKEPALRLRVLEDAGRSAVPFTTGVLLGIGENYAERVDAVVQIRASAQRHGHVQEVIVQNFRAKPRTAMQAHDDLELQEYVAAVAVTRLLLGPKARVQAPPNLSDSTELGLLLRAGVDDWGGVSPADPRPRQSRAAVAEHRQAGRAVGRGRVRAARAPGRAAPVRAVPRAVAGPAGASARVRPRRAGRARRRGPRPGGPAVAGAGRGVDVVGPGGPARGGGHGRAHVGPAQRLRRRLRRLGRAPRPDDGGAGRSLDGAACRRPRGARGAAPRRAGPGGADRRRVPGAAGGGRDGPGSSGEPGRRRPRRRQRRRRHLRREPEHQLHQRLLHRLPVLRLRPAAHRRRRVHAVDGAGRRPGRRGVGGRRHRDLHAGRHPPRPAGHGVLRPGARGEEAAARHPPARLLTDGDRQRRRPDRAVVRGLPDRREARPDWTPCPARRRRSSTTTSAGC